MKKTDPIDGKYTSTLTVSGITAEMDGAYICYVKYEDDVQLEDSFNLHVLRELLGPGVVLGM